MFRRHLTPSLELKVSRLFSTKCHFGGNELVYGEEACHNGRQKVRPCVTVHAFVRLTFSSEEGIR